MNRVIVAWLLALAILLISAAVHAVEFNARGILFSSVVRSPERGKQGQGIFLVTSTTSATPLISLNAQCPQHLKDIAFGANGDLFLLLDCNSLLPDVAQLNPASGTLISPPILNDDLLFDTVDLLPDRDGSLLILCKSGCNAQQGKIRGLVLRVNPTSHAVTVVVNPYQLGPYQILQNFISTGLAIDQQGRLFIAGYHGSTAPGNAMIVKVDPANSTAETFATLEEFDQIANVVIDQAGYISIAGLLPPAPPTFTHLGAITRINSKNSDDRTIFSGGILGEWNAINRITVDLNSDLLVTSYWGILRFTPTGGQTLVYDPPPTPPRAPNAIAVVPETPLDIVKIPIEVTHTIPLDHVGIAGPLRYVLATRGLEPPGMFILNSNGDLMRMNDVVFGADGANFSGDGLKPVTGIKPSEFDPSKHTFRARSHIMVEFDRTTRHFTITSPLEDMLQGGIGNAYEKATSVSGALDCFRKDNFGDGTCLTLEAKSDTLVGIPMKLSAAPAAFKNEEIVRQLIPVTSEDSGMVIVNLKMANFLPLVTHPIDVDWEFDLWLDFRNPDAPAFVLAGAHDSFPLYEIYLGDQRIYTYDGVAAGHGPSGLSPFFYEDIENLGGTQAGPITFR